MAEPLQVGNDEVITRLEAQNLSCELNRNTRILKVPCAGSRETKGNETCKGDNEPLHLVAEPLQGGGE